jgi:hypothetical protein
VDAAALAAAGAVLDDLVAEVWADADVAAALAAPAAAPLLVYRGGGVLEELAQSTGVTGDDAAGSRQGEPREAAGGVGTGMGVGVEDGGAEFAGYVIDSALVGAMQDLVDEGALGGGGGGGAGGRGSSGGGGAGGGSGAAAGGPQGRRN